MLSSNVWEVNSSDNNEGKSVRHASANIFWNKNNMSVNSKIGKYEDLSYTTTITPDLFKVFCHNSDFFFALWKLLTCKHYEFKEPACASLQKLIFQFVDAIITISETLLLIYFHLKPPRYLKAFVAILGKIPISMCLLFEV